MEITLQGLLIGALGIAIGLALVFKGFRLFLLLLPVLGFIGGFLLGAGFVEWLFGEAFLATLLGWVTGFLVGIVFAVLSYFYYWAAVGIFGGVIGYQLTIGILAWIGFDASGVFAMLIGFLVALVFGVAFLVLRMPTVLAIVGTALVGAAATVAGIIVALGFAAHSQLSDGIFGVYSSEELGWVGILALIGLSLGGMLFQARSLTPDDTVISPDAYRNPGIGGPGGPAPA